MVIPGVDVKVKRHIRYLPFVCLASLVFIVAGCKAEIDEVRKVNITDVVPTGRVISVEEALSLYGIDSETEVEPEGPSVTTEPWFPMEVWVSASVLPYDDPDPILVLPVYADSELGVKSIWVGDLEAGSNVMLLSVHPNDRACFVKGVAHQGWVACNRLLFHEPTPVVNRDVEGE
jgi:hypothetical protein